MVETSEEDAECGVGEFPREVGGVAIFQFFGNGEMIVVIVVAGLNGQVDVVGWRGDNVRGTSGDVEFCVTGSDGQVVVVATVGTDAAVSSSAVNAVGEPDEARGDGEVDCVCCGGWQGEDP